MHKKKVVIGLTGQTGAGKSTVSGMLQSRGLRLIDADIVARQVVEKGKQCLVDLALEFGIEILDGDGNLNRKKLAGIVFTDKEKRKRLNEITFPYIQQEILDLIDHYKLAGDRVIILDAPTLLESGSDQYCDKVVSVIAPKDMRLERILQRDGITYKEAENRMSSQHADEYYTSQSDFVIRNDGSMTHLRVQLMEMLNVCCEGIDLIQPLQQEELSEE